MDLNNRFFTYSRNGMDDHEQPRSIPLVPILFGEG